MNKFTKQGVRDLNSLQAKKVGKRLAPLPDEVQQSLCSHKSNSVTKLDYGIEQHRCNQCGYMRWID